MFWLPASGEERFESDWTEGAPWSADSVKEKKLNPSEIGGNRNVAHIISAALFIHSFRNMFLRANCASKSNHNKRK